MKRTISDIARTCGVSRGTVDRVLHGRPHVLPETRAKVESVLRESGYSVGGTGREPVSSSIVTIAVLLPKWHDSYFARQTYAGINDAEHAINDSALRVLTYEMTSRSPDEYIALLDRLAGQGVNGIVLSAAQSSVIEMKIDELAVRGIAVVTYDSDVPNSKRVCYIGQDLYRSGAIAAGLMARFMRPNDEVLIVTGRMDFETGKARVDGFVRYLQSQGFSPDCYTIAECYERFDATSATVCSALRERPRLKYIYMANESVSGCVDGVRKAQAGHPVRIICNDLTPAAKKYLQNGQIDFIIGQTFTQKAYKAVITLYNLLRRGMPPKKDKLYTDSFIISQELL